MVVPKVLSLACAAQTYAWGKIGSESAVARLAAGGNKGFAPEQGKPYAELWMGAHPKAPSLILNDGVEPKHLGDWLKQNPAALSSTVRDRFAGELPFLFKILSINNALSIQAHPNKTHAEQLFAADPKNYPDPNHKPEMAIALTDFQGMCGFRPYAEVASFLQRIPELAAVTGAEVAAELSKAVASNAGEEQSQAALRKCFSNLMHCDDDLVKAQLGSLVARLSAQPAAARSATDQLLLDLHEQFPGDVGCFCIYYLNVVELKPGEAIFLAANVPHAYIRGDCVECMACSDNVVRAGLTPKFKDVDTLCAMLVYQGAPAQAQVFTGQPDAALPHIRHYPSQVRDFAVSRCTLAAGQAGSLGAVPGPSISIVTSGSGTATWAEGSLALSAGHVFFTAADADVHVSAAADGIELYRAYCV